MTEVVSIVLDDRDPWDQLPDEPKIIFEKFDIFRLIGPMRTIPKAYRKWRVMQNNPVEHTATSASWYRNANKWRWEERARSWDEYIREQREDEAQDVMNQGLALAHVRVEKLGRVAKKIEDYILDERTTRISPILIEQYRGILNDIALEMGQRQKELRLTGPAGGNIVIETQWGRGGSASEAWEKNQIAAPTIEATVTEVLTDQ